jgi:hypothetical protein
MAPTRPSNRIELNQLVADAEEWGAVVLLKVDREG